MLYYFQNKELSLLFLKRSENGPFILHHTCVTISCVMLHYSLLKAQISFITKGINIKFHYYAQILTCTQSKILFLSTTVFLEYSDSTAALCRTEINYSIL